MFSGLFQFCLDHSLSTPVAMQVDQKKRAQAVLPEPCEFSHGPSGASFHFVLVLQYGQGICDLSFVHATGSYDLCAGLVVTGQFLC